MNLSGRIVNMSSIQGKFTWPCAAAYNASKYSIECMSDTLRMEMRKFGVKVAIIEPAMFGGNTDIHSEQNVSYIIYIVGNEKYSTNHRFSLYIKCH